MKHQKMMRVFLYATMLVSWLSVSAMAQSPKIEEPIAAIAADSTEIKWQPRVEYYRLVLRVSTPDGEVFTKQFEAGTIPSFKLINDSGLKLRDGQYVYELRLIPNLDPEVKRALAAARENGNSDEVVQELQRSGQLPTHAPVQSGAFSVQEGAVYVSGPEEPGSSRVKRAGVSVQSSGQKNSGVVTILDQVIPDDLIVQGSACVGLDCVNNESFGFDTIRLKENNTRIKFDDTSTAAGFPANDWQLTANDSANGGASKFSIEDITGAKVPFTLTAGAPTNSVFVSSTGRVGFRTSTPVLDLHVNTGDTPAARLEQNNSSGFTAQTWDVAGNEANFFVRDVTGGSRLPFRIRPGAPTSSIDINASGRVGIGTSSPLARLHVGTQTAAPIITGSTLVVEESGDTTMVIKSSAGGEFFVLQNNSLGVIGTSSNHPLDVRTNNTTRIFATAAGNVGFGGLTTPTNPIEHSNGARLTAGGVWTNASSKAMKMNIRTLSTREALKALLGLRPVTFQYRAEPGEAYVGFIAEDVPDLVATNDRKSLSSMDIVAVLTKAVQEQQKTIAELKEKVARLEKSRVRQALLEKRKSK